jgi:hypothetical protein
MVWGKVKKEKVSLLIFSFWAFPISDHVCVIGAPSGGHGKQSRKDFNLSLRARVSAANGREAEALLKSRKA